MLHRTMLRAPLRAPHPLRALLAVVVGLCAGLALAPLPGGAQSPPQDRGNQRAASSGVGFVSDATEPQRAPVARRASVNIGAKFTSTRSGRVTALQFYRSDRQKKAYAASLWDRDGALLGRATFRARATEGWQTARLGKPVRLQKDRLYVVSYLASHGNYVSKPRGFAKARHVNGFTVPRNGGLITGSRTSVRPRNSAVGANFLVDVVFTPNGPARTPWPAADNTGVPDGTSLSPYGGPLTITRANTVIRNAEIVGTLEIEAPGVQIINSRILGRIDLVDPRSTDHSFTITDSEVHVGAPLDTGIMRGNFTATRVEVTGGNRSIYCEINCTIVDSWVHAQGADVGGDAHFSGIRMGESTTLRHNTITCEAARGPGTGCSAGLTGYGDFGPVQNNLIENNIFHGGGGGGSTVCAYGGSSGEDGGKPYGHLANNIRFIDNVFARGASGRCGNIRAISGFNASRPGNVWSGNTWDDGTAIHPSD